MLAIAGVLVVAGAFAAEPAQALWARLPSAQARLLQLERELFRGGALGEADWQRSLSGLAGSAALPAAATVFLLYFLLVSEQALVIRCMQLCATPRNRACVLGALRDMQRDIRTFLCTMVATSVLLGIATGFALAAIGFPDAAFWGLFTAVITIIPYLGPALVTVALVLAGSAVYGAGWLLVVPAGLFLVLHFLESNLLTPFLMGAGLRIRPVFIVLAVLALSGSWGLAGGFVAVPILLAVRAIGLRSRWSRMTRLVLQDRGALPEPRALLRRGPR
jgi:predicted PurR-regulated permease PerM